MHNIMVIARREFKSYFDSPVAYIVITFFLIIAGYFFTSNLFLSNQADLRTLWGIIPLLFVFFIPAISMKLLADEKKTGTIELLYTYPIRDSEIVLGKYFAALFLLGVMLLFTVAYAFTVNSLGNMDVGQAIAGYIGLILMAAAYLAIGVFASSVTDNQIIAFILALFISFFFFIADKIIFFLPSGIAGIFEYLGIEYHFQNIARGVIDSRNVLYFASLIFFGLLLASHSLSRRRGD
ncbi:MAG: ABC transporter permease subunit [Calditrichaeota bacterium]|nr:ABC transporter permease subunit [Calditrichota bacterium]MCB9366747.1 ABC transporter permease subunit [Calditrichota bacterium]